MVATSVALPTTNPNIRRRDVQIGGRTVEVVPEFTYIASKDSDDKSLEAELRAGMLAANRLFYSLRHQFTSKNLSLRTKLGLYSTYIVSVLTYASKAWTLSKSDETLLDTFERKILRRILVWIPYVCRDNVGAAITTSYTRCTDSDTPAAGQSSCSA